MQSSIGDRRSRPEAPKANTGANNNLVASLSGRFGDVGGGIRFGGARFSGNSFCFTAAVAIRWSAVALLPLGRMTN